MTSLLQLKPRLRAATSILSFRQTAFNPHNRRLYAQDSKSTGEDRSAQRDSGGKEGSPKHPIPSNKAHPTLHDGRQSPLADFEGNLKEDLPEDVRRHNKEVEERYDRPYNHMGDAGGVEKGWKKK